MLIAHPSSRRGLHRPLQLHPSRGRPRSAGRPYRNLRPGIPRHGPLVASAKENLGPAGGDAPEANAPQASPPEAAVGTTWGGSAEEASPAESWDKEGGSGDWEGKEPAPVKGAQPWLGNTLLVAVVMAAGLAAGGLFRTIRHHRLQASVPPASVAGDIKGTVPQAQQAQQAQAQHSVQQARQQQWAEPGWGSAYSEDGPGAYARTAEAEEAAWGQGGRYDEELGGGSGAADSLESARHGGGSAAAATGAGKAASSAQHARARARVAGSRRAHGAATEEAHGKEAALARIRRLQAEHLRQLEEQDQHQHHPTTEGQVAAAAASQVYTPSYGATAGDWAGAQGGESAPATAAHGYEYDYSATRAGEEAGGGLEWPEENRRAGGAGPRGQQELGAPAWGEQEGSSAAAVDYGGQHDDGYSQLGGGVAYEEGEGERGAEAAVDEAAPAAEVPEGLGLEALAQRARAANRAAAAAAGAAHRAADASAVAAEAAHRAAQHAQQAQAASASAQSAFNLHQEDAVEEALNKVKEAEALAVEAQALAIDAADQAAVAAAKGTMSERDAARLARKACKAAELSQPYSVTDQVAGWWRSSRRAVVDTTQRAQQATVSTVQQVKQSAVGAVEGTKGAALSAVQQTRQATAVAAQGTRGAVAGVAQRTREAAGGAAQWVQAAGAPVGSTLQSWWAWLVQALGQLREQAAGLAASAGQSVPVQKVRAGLTQVQHWKQEQFKGK